MTDFYGLTLQSYAVILDWTPECPGDVPIHIIPLGEPHLLRLGSKEWA